MSSENRGLTERKKQILKAIVDAHIEGGGPVGSKYILQNQQLKCSSATIRNEMAELEEMGYLEQDEDVLSYALIPEVSKKFFEYRKAKKYGLDADHADSKLGVHAI